MQVEPARLRANSKVGAGSACAPVTRSGKETDLVPGDVVTAVNGRPIERPEQAFAAFQSIAVAKELRVTYERNNARREIAYPIDESPVP